MLNDPLDLPTWRRTALAALRVSVVYTSTAQQLRQGPAILTCNHESLIDGIAVAFASPVPLCFAVTPDYAIRNRATARGLSILSRLGLGTVVPLSQDSPMALRGLLAALREGQSVMIFPTGTIRAEAETKRGYRWLAEKAGCPILTASISGASRSLLFAKNGSALRPRITLTF